MWLFLLELTTVDYRASVCLRYLKLVIDRRKNTQHGSCCWL